MKLATRLFVGPDADLAHLPLSLDPRAISIGEGLRAALAVAALVAVNEWLNAPALAEAALGALLTCLGDPGGPIRRRVPALVAFTLLGTAAVFLFSLLRAIGILPAALVASCWIFACAYARAWGPGPMQVGNLLTVAAVLALDRGFGPRDSALIAALFGSGSIWALLLTLVIWRVHPFRPARRAVADVYTSIGVLARDIAEQLDVAAHPDWAAHARAHRRYVRERIEAARQHVLDVLRARGPGGPRGNALLIQLEAAEQIFGAVIALSDVVEEAEPAMRDAVRPVLPALRLLLAGIADGIMSDQVATETNRPLFLHLMARIEAPQQGPALAEVTHSLLERLRVAALIITPDGDTTAGSDPGEPGLSVGRLLAPLRSNLAWSSPALRHAVRATVAGFPALLITLPAGATYVHWLTITLVLTLQPFFALTWQRALERVGGTVLGGIAAAMLATLVHGPVATAAALFPLTVAAFAVRRVSFGLFMAALTPVVVLLSELGRPGEGELAIALWRAIYTMAGGAMAVAAGLLLWPSWEPARVRQDLRAAIDAHAAYAEAELATLLGQASAGAADRARRAAGLSSNTLEATLSRALQEPGHATKRELQAAMLADAALRRVAGRLAALQHAPNLASSAGSLAEWRDWLRRSFAALADGAPPPAPVPHDAPSGALARIGRQIALIDGALRAPDTI